MYRITKALQAKHFYYILQDDGIEYTIGDDSDIKKLDTILFLKGIQLKEYPWTEYQLDQEMWHKDHDKFTTIPQDIEKNIYEIIKCIE